MDPLGPLLTLRRLLLSDQALATFRLFITKYWYTVILAAIAVIALMVTIVKLCGKKTPLLERRRRRRPRSVHHESGEGEGSREAVHIHPTAVKASLPFMGRSYRLEREARRREKEERKTRRKSSGGGGELPARKEEEPREAMEGLAARLGQRLVVSLPPEPRAGPASAPLAIDTRRITSDEARQAVSSWLTTVSPQPEGEEERVEKPREKEKVTFSEKEKDEGKRKRSKSMSKVQDMEKEGGVVKGERQGRGRRKVEEAEEGDQVEEDKKGVTIAKLGPFKMSMELKGAGGGGGKGEKVEVEKVKVRSRSRSKPGDERSRRQSRKEEEKVAKVQEEAPPAEAEKEKEAKKPEKKKKERIVVSKMARSDRPLRERSPEKPRAKGEGEGRVRGEEGEGRSGGEEEDYRLTLNRRREKFTRSVSQPGPAPPGLDFLLPAVTAGARNRSFAEPLRTPVQGLRRSNTLQEEVRWEEEPEEGARSGTVYDNLGYDRSPDLRTGIRSADRRQQTLAALKDSLQEQLARTAPPLSLPSTAGRRRRESRRYQVMPEEEEQVVEGEEAKASDSDSLSSDPRLCRQSPPTQVPNPDS